MSYDAHPSAGMRTVVLGADGEVLGELERPSPHGLGFDDDGNWELGIFPLLLPAAKGAAALAVRVRQARAAQGKPPLVREALDRFRQPQGAPAFPSPAQPAPTHPGGGMFSAWTVQGAPVPTTEDLVLGAMRRPQMPPRAQAALKRCRIRKKGGRMFAYDPSTGEHVEVMGFDDDDGDVMGYAGEYGDQFGADDYDDDFLGGADGDDDDFDELGEAEDELLGAADFDDDASFAGKEERLQKKIDKLEAKAEKIRDKIADMRGPFKGPRRKKLNKRLKRIVKRLEKARAKLRKAQGKRKDAISQADKSLAAAGLVAAGAAGGVATGAVINSREGAKEIDMVRDPIGNPLTAERMRRAQAQAGLSADYRAPAGSGRLQPVAMTQSGTTNPRNALTVPAGGLTTNTTLFAETLSYARVRLVGFMTSTYGSDATAAAIGMVEDLKIQGSGNLFLQEGPIPAQYFDTTIDRLTSLRWNPEVKSPNQAQVDIAAAGDQNDVIVLTCAVVYDVIWDDTYGPGFPGPYS